MEEICLVTALTVSDFIDPDLTVDAHSKTGAQLGVLTLAALLRQQNYVPRIVNLDDLFFVFVRLDKSRPSLTHDWQRSSKPPETFYSFVARHLPSEGFGVYGLSSICSSYPLTLRLAQEIRRLNPHARIILGGPQASVVDVATMHAFPCIDIIVRGEADDTFPALLHLLDNQLPEWEKLPGITFRRDDEVIRNPNAPVFENLDRLPLPAFDLDLRIRDRGGVHLEIGRGCPFACTFCSTNDFFRRNFRLKSPATMVRDIASLQKKYGLNYFSLVHDMYTIDRKKVVAFCEEILASGEKFTWGCSARTDCIDDDLLQLMASAGCTGIFFGIETGSQRLQHVINKKLDLDEARHHIEAADRNGIQTTVALIAGFPEETPDDLRDTLHFFIDSLRFDHAEPQCSLLAPLAATPVYYSHKHHLIFDQIYSDMSHQSWQQDPVEIEMIKTHEDIFPNFYAIPTPELERSYVKETIDFATYLATWFRWLPVAILQDSGDMLSVFDRWRRWRVERRASETDEDNGWTPYYSHRRFHTEFLEFVETCYLPEMAKAPAAIAAIAKTENAPALEHRKPIVQETNRLDDSAVPYQLDSLFIVDVEVDYKELIERLRSKSDLNEVSARDATVVFSNENDDLEVWQLPPLAGILLRLCDGKRTVAEITQEFSLLEIELGDVPADKACLFGLVQLIEDGVVGLSSVPLQWENDAVPNFSFPPKSRNTQQPWPPDSTRDVL
ncbi:MAG TPA: radical SAM protein [Pyrinomonadaceae bacterium]|nr:radical SAM protein [Pyrinomonadaceae bacterium]